MVTWSGGLVTGTASAGKSSASAEASSPYRWDVPGDANVAAVARLLADDTRAAMMLALLDGRYRTAGELAAVGGVAASTASSHLSRLVNGGLIESTSQGRHRYFRLAGPGVAAVVEALATLAPSQPVRSLREARVGEALRAGRTCYDHLAGRLGLAITQWLVVIGVVDEDLNLSDASVLAGLGIVMPDSAGAGPSVRSCVDWTERRPHIAGALPAALTRRLFELEWLQRLGTSRAVRLTPAGERGLSNLVGVPVSCNTTEVADSPVVPTQQLTVSAANGG